TTVTVEQLPANLETGSAAVEEGIRKYCENGSICVFRSGGTKIRSESVLLGTIELCQTGTWADRITLAVVERDTGMIELHKVRGAPISVESVRIDGSAVTLQDLL